jgi:rhamnosyltransferase
LRVIVVDNGSGPAAASTLDSIAALPSVAVIRNPENLGIARALNQGADAAADLGAEWLLTIDQDTVPGPEIVRIAADCFESYPEHDRVAVIGSASIAALPQTAGQADPGRPWIDVKYVITAGSFVPLAVFRALGGFRDDLFVDYVDIEFCLRARSRGYRVLACRTPAMTHRVGRPTARRIGGRAVKTTNHTAVRRYYMTRNRILIWRRYWRTDTRFVVRDIVVSRIELLKVLLFERDRTRKLRAILAGTVDGVRGISGRKVFATDESSRKA